MRTWLQPTIIMLLYVCLRAGDLAICAAIARDIIRAVLYGIVAVLALIALIVALLL
jgi:hypothetical protein